MADTQSKIALVITADASGAIQVSAQAGEAIRGVGKATQEVEQQSLFSLQRLRQEWLGLTAAAYAALQAIRTGWNLAEQAAAYQEQLASLNALAARYGTTGVAIRDAVREATGGLLSMADATRIAGQSLLQGLGPDQVATLARGAAALTDVTGQQLPEAFQTLTRAIATGREQTLEAAIGTIDLAQKYGKLAESMSEAEKRAATYGIIVERLTELQRQLGEGTVSVADRMDRFKAELDNLRLLVGEGLIRAFMAAYGVLQLIDAGVLQLIAGLAKLVSWLGFVTDKLGITTRAYEDWADWAQTAWDAQATLTQQGFDKIIGAFSTWEQTARAYRPPTLVDQGAIDRAADELGKLEAQLASIRAATARTSARGLEQELAAAIALVEAQRQASLDRITQANYRNAEKVRELQTAIGAQAAAEIAKIREDYGDKIVARDIANIVAVAEAQVNADFANQQAIAAADVRAAEERKARQDAAGEAYIAGWVAVIEQQMQADWDAAQAAVKATEARFAFEREQREAMIALARQQREEDIAGMEAVFAQLVTMANAVGGEAGKGLGQMAANLKGLFDIQIGEDEYTKDMERRIQHYMELYELESQHLISMEQLNKAHDDLMAAQDAAAQGQMLEAAKRSFGFMAGTMLALYNMTGQKHNEMFAAYKAFSIGEALISTYLGAAKAMAATPWYPVNLAMALATIAFGMAQVAAIASQQPGGGAATAPSPGGAGGYNYNQPTVSQWEPQQQQEQQRPLTVQVTVLGNLVDHDQFARDLVPAIRKAQEDNV